MWTEAYGPPRVTARYSASQVPGRAPRAGPRIWNAAMRLRLPHATVDLDARVVRGRTGEVALTPTEARLLARLAATPGEVVSRERLLAEVWGYGPRVVSRTVDTTAHRLRAKLEPDPARPVHLLTVPGVGLRLVLGAPPADDTVGREAEREALEAALESVRLVTLVGPGGAGKTRLARDLARDRGGLFVDLVPAQDAEGLHLALARAVLGATTDPLPSPEALAEAALARGTRLLVLDNLEPVVEAAAALVPRLGAAAPALRFLGTSREPLGVAGERVLPLAGLGPEAAFRLLVARAPHPVDPAWHDRATVEPLLAALDRLPLAIELAAGWAHTLAPGQVLERLADRLDGLASERRDLPPRHRSLRAAVDSSLALLDPGDRAALGQLAVFAGAFSMEDAEAVVHPGPAAVRVRRLVHHSLVHPDPGAPGRFRLYEAVRARMREEGPDPATRLRLARHLAATPTRTLPGLDRQADLRLALDAAMQAGEREVAVGCARVLASAPEAPGDDTARRLDALLALGVDDPALHFDRANLDFRAGRLAEARARLDALLARPLPDDLAVRSLALRAALRRDLGDSDGALADLDAALPRAGSDPGLRGTVLGDAAVVLARRGATTLAEARFREAIALLEGTADVATLAATLSNLASLHRELGRDPLPLLNRAVALHRSVGNLRSVAIALGTVGIAHLDAGDFARARAAFVESLDLLARAGARHVAAVFRSNLAYLDRLEGRLEAARAGWEAALVGLRAAGDLAYEAMALGNLGELRAEAGEEEAGLGLLDEAVARAAAARFRKVEGVFLGAAGLLRVRRGEVEAGLASLERADALLAEGGFRDERCRLLARRAQAAAALGDPEEARRRLAEAEALARPLPWIERELRAAREAVAAALVSPRARDGR